MTFKKLTQSIAVLFFLSSDALATKNKKDTLPDTIARHIKKLKAMGYNTSYNTACKNSLSPSVTIVGETHADLRYPPAMPNTGIVMNESDSEICNHYPEVDFCVPIDVDYKNEDLVTQLYTDVMSYRVDILCYLDPKMKSSFEGLIKTERATIDHKGEISFNEDKNQVSKINQAIKYFGIKNLNLTNIDLILEKEMQKKIASLPTFTKNEEKIILALTNKMLFTKQKLNRIIHNDIPDRDETMANQILSALSKLPKGKKKGLAIVGNNHVPGMRRKIEKNKKVCVVTARL